MADKVYNVKLPEDVRDRWQKLVSGIAEQNGIKKLGDVYPYLMEIIEAGSVNVAPDFQGFVNTISSNLSSIRSSVMAMSDAYQSYQESALQEKERSERELVEQIKELKREKESLKENESRLVAENEGLKKKVEQLESQIDEQKNIEKILAKLNSLISEDEEREKEKGSSPDEPIEGQVTLNDYR